MASMIDKARAIHSAAAALPMLRKQAADTTDETALLDMATLFPTWQSQTPYKAGDVLRHNGSLFRVAQTHTAQAHQPPDAAGMLAVYTPVQAPSAQGAILDWKSGESLAVGDKRRDLSDGKVYEAIQNPGVNVWEPHTVPALWKAVS